MLQRLSKNPVCQTCGEQIMRVQADTNIGFCRVEYHCGTILKLRTTTEALGKAPVWVEESVERTRLCLELRLAQVEQEATHPPLKKVS